MACPCGGAPVEPGAPPCATCRGTGVYEEEVAYEDLMTPDLRRFLPTFSFYRRSGTLPEPGGLNAQPATWVVATSLLSGWVDEAIDREHERERAELAKKQKRR